MGYFYRFMVWLSHADYTIANSTGRNPDYTRAARRDWNYWRNQMQLWEIRNGI